MHGLSRAHERVGEVGGARLPLGVAPLRDSTRVVRKVLQEAHRLVAEGDAGDIDPG